MNSVWVVTASACVVCVLCVCVYVCVYVQTRMSVWVVLACVVVRRRVSTQSAATTVSVRLEPALTRTPWPA